MSDRPKKHCHGVWIPTVVVSRYKHYNISNCAIFNFLNYEARIVY